MQNDIEAMNEIWNNSLSHRKEYASKIADLNKVIISVSGVMLSVLGAFYTLGDSLPNEGALAIQLSLVLFLLAILFGIASIHGHAEIHQKFIEHFFKLQRDRSPSEALEEMRCSIVSQSRIYSWSNSLCSIMFFLALMVFTCRIIIAL